MSATTANKNDNLTLEERLQPWLDQAEYLIFFVMGVMLWSAIFVNLAGFLASQLSEGAAIPERAVAGLIFIVPTFGLWLYPIFSLKGLDRAKRGLGFLQRHPWVLLLIYGVLLFLMVSTTNRSIWSPYALIQICLLILLVMFTLVVLFLQPSKDAPFQTWRKVVIGAIGLYFVVEAVLYGLLIGGVISIVGDSGIGIAYGRIATDDEAINITQSNQYGWHYPDYRLEDDTHRILIHGDSFVQALQVGRDEHFGVRLDGLLNSNEESAFEVMAQGFPGYGPTMYLNDNMAQYIWEPLEPNETIIVFHMLNDFQIETTFDNRISYSYLTGIVDDRAFVSSDILDVYHPNSHNVIAGHDPIDPYRTILSYSMIWNLFESSQGGRYDEQALNMDEVSADAPFGAAGILYDTDADGEIADNTYAITEAILADYVDKMNELGITTIRMVTIPYFPEQFYAENSGSDWGTIWGNYDLSLPESEMQAIADDLGIDFLGMVNYLQGTDIERVQSYYFENGTGHLTVTGHQVFAEAIYNCFYAETVDERCN